MRRASPPRLLENCARPVWLVDDGGGGVALRRIKLITQMMLYDVPKFVAKSAHFYSTNFPERLNY
jgi:hypothetical protein